MARRLALITGASAGIGAAFARIYARRGCDVAICARRNDKLEDLAQELETTSQARVKVIALDLAAPTAATQLLNALPRTPDILVNNAGFGLPGDFADSAWDAHSDFLQLMLTTPLELAHKCLGDMQDKRWGRIINVASLAGFAPAGRGHTLYAATKAALIRFSQSLHLENRNHGVHVTAVCPGFTRSEFHDVNGMRDKVDQMPEFLWQSAEDVAESGWEASERNRPVAVTGGVNKAIATALKLMPDDIALEIMRARSDAMSPQQK